MENNLTQAPRPSSLRALTAWFFVLSFRNYKDDLQGDDPAPFEQRIRQLMWWPPDVFALTSAVLARTGAYRMVVGPNGPLGQNLWQRLDWQHRVEAHAEAWRSVVSELILSPLNKKNVDEEGAQPYADKLLMSMLAERIKNRCDRRHLQPLKLCASQSTSEDQKVFSTLIEAFIHDITQLKDNDGPLADQNLLAVSVKADRLNRPGAGDSERNAARFFEAIIGLHILADAASDSIGVPRSSTQESAVFDALANVLLTLRGSLSTVSKFHGVVLPKMRTPQAGLTLRNLSHNLTFHDCEVEVMWRSFPWANFDENTLNVLYIPYPFDFDPNRFKSETAHYENVGYFTYKPGDWEGIGSVVDLIEQVRTRGGIHPHMLVFTETAFNEDAYKRLLTALSHRYGADGPQSMPIVVAGVAKEEHGLPYNELRLATYFAGKWYQMVQHKHHRWQLNESQIRQYGLQGRLSTARPLFERSVIDQRRLSFYAPTPWLVLSPLICEDLSRIEPVSELIRGVGPTLVLALLLDGPQLEGRWPGRYASVLADDPGTGVLTVTSYGIAKASRPSTATPSGTNSEKNETSNSDSVVVASWKGPDSPFQRLSAVKDEALLVTLTAAMGEEFTLDRRGVAGKAAGFRLDGVERFKMPTAKAPQGIDTGLDLGNWSDIREITAVTYVASAALSLLRPHLSKHPTEANERSDTWKGMYKWNERCQHVRQLIDVMLGRPAFYNNDKWDDLFKEEKNRLQDDKKLLPYDKSNDLKVKRNILLNHIFEDADGKSRAPNRHLFAVFCFAQTTIDVEVRDEEAVWPTDSLRFACTVLRTVLDSIAGINPFTEKLKLKNGAASQVYQRRLEIAGRANRLRPGEKGKLWEKTTAREGAEDVEDAPSPLYIPFTNDEANTFVQGKNGNARIKYLLQFEHLHQPNGRLRDLEGVYPNRYDFYKMTLALVKAILEDEEASLWKHCQLNFEGNVGITEMRRLTILVLMILPALIHEQLEFERIRLKRSGEVDLSSTVMYDLMKQAEEILKNAAKKARTPWNPKKN